jgi:uncharacterized protein YggE
MKKLLLLSTLVIAFSISISAQQSVEGVPTVKVTGTAEVFVVPDEVTFAAKVEKNGKTVAEAKRLHDQAMGKLLATARRFVKDEKDIKTDFLSVAEHYKRVRSETSPSDYTNVFDGYKVSRSVTIKLRDVSKFEQALSELIEADVSDIGRVTFGTSEMRKHKDEARANAIAAAREKATALAARIGQTIGKAVSIEEENVDGYRSPYANISSNSFTISDSDDDDEDVSAVGTISVKAQVEVSFILN